MAFVENVCVSSSRWSWCVAVVETELERMAQFENVEAISNEVHTGTYIMRSTSAMDLLEEVQDLDIDYPRRQLNVDNQMDSDNDSDDGHSS